MEWSTAEGMINFVWGWILGKLQRRGVTQAGSGKLLEIFPDLWDVERCVQRTEEWGSERVIRP